MWSYFTHEEIHYSQRNSPNPGLPKAQLFYYGTNTLRFRVSPIWNNLPAVGSKGQRFII